MIVYDISTIKERPSLHRDKGEVALKLRCPITEIGKGEPKVLSANRKELDKCASRGFIHGVWGPSELAM